MENTKNSDVGMDLWVVVIDETEYWSEKVLQDYPEIKRIFGVYLTDLSSRTFIASMDPSAWLEHLATEWDGDYLTTSDERKDEIFDQVLPTDLSVDDYFTYNFIKNAPEIKPATFPEGEIGKIHYSTITPGEIQNEYDGNREDAFESAREDLQGNPLL